MRSILSHDYGSSGFLRHGRHQRPRPLPARAAQEEAPDQRRAAPAAAPVRKNRQISAAARTRRWAPELQFAIACSINALQPRCGAAVATSDYLQRRCLSAAAPLGKKRRVSAAARKAISEEPPTDTPE